MTQKITYVKIEETKKQELTRKIASSEKLIASWKAELVELTAQGWEPANHARVSRRIKTITYNINRAEGILEYHIEDLAKLS